MARLFLWVFMGHSRGSGPCLEHTMVFLGKGTFRKYSFLVRSSRHWFGSPLVVEHHVLALFRTSLEDGTLPSQWRHAKIIPLKKPGKEDYTTAKAWRPISLLATLGKVLESVIAERLSHAVETYGLLPTRHFGGRKQRSAEQALVFL